MNLFDYHLIYKEKKKPELILVVGEEKEVIAKLFGRCAEHVFNKILEMPNAWEILEPIKSVKSGRSKVYGIRQDIAPIIASYMLLVRKSPKPEKWDWYLNEVMNGKLAKTGRSLSAIVEMVFTLSNEFGISKSMDIVSGVLKEFARRIL